MMPLLPADLAPGFPHVVALAPAAFPGTASELLANGQGRAVGLFTCEAGAVGQAFRSQLGLIKGYLGAGVAVLFACETRRDLAEARRRLAAIAPAGFTIREAA
jgi:hypothetical protein